MSEKKIDKGFRLWILLQRTRDTIYNARNKELMQYGISIREAAVLDAIYQNGETVSINHIAQWVYRRPHTVAGILRRMQKKGLVKLSKDKKIKNLVRINMTEEGQRLYKMATRKRVIGKVFKDLTDEEYDQMHAALSRFNERALKITGDTIIDRRIFK